MPGVLDFLFEGRPPASVTTYGQTVENIPKWLSDYTQGMIGRANVIAAEPYQAYEGPRIAGFSPDQLAAFEGVRSNVGSYDPYAESADRTLTGGLTQAAGYLGAGTQGAPGEISEFVRAGTQGMPSDVAGYLGAGTRGVPGVAADYIARGAEGLPSDVAGYLGAGTRGLPGQVSGYLGAGTEGISGDVSRYLGAGTGVGSGLAQEYIARGAEGVPSEVLGYLEAGAQDFPSSVNQYMDPFIGNVLNRQAELSGRQLTEQFLPALQNTFVGSGSFGGDRMMELGIRGTRDIAEGLQGQQLGALSQAYGQAGQLFGADRARQLEAASLAGGLSEAERGRQFQAAGLTGDLEEAQMGRQLQAAGITGGLEEAERGRQLQAAGLAGGFGEAEMARQLQAAGLAGGFGEAERGRQFQAAGLTGEFSEAEMGRQLEAARLSGGFNEAEMARQLQAAGLTGDVFDAEMARQMQAAGVSGELGIRGAGQYGALGEAASTAGFRDTAAMEAIGAQQRGLGQQSLDLAYGDFLRQQGYPREMIDWMSQTIRGLPAQGGVTTTQQTGPADIYGPSPLAQVASGYSIYRGLGE